MSPTTEAGRLRKKLLAWEQAGRSPVGGTYLRGFMSSVERRTGYRGMGLRFAVRLATEDELRHLDAAVAWRAAHSIGNSFRK